MSDPARLDRCECGAVADAMISGWHFLSIRNAWRCGACTHALMAAGQFAGTLAEDFVDPLPPDSRGALPKATASTIVAPEVKP